MRVLVDTHTFLWDLNDDPRSSRKAREFFSSDEHELVFSLVSLWEIAIKIRTGKLNTIGSSVAYIRDEMNAYGIELLPIRYEHILTWNLSRRIMSTPSTACSSPRRSRRNSPSSPPTRSFAPTAQGPSGSIQSA